MALRTVFTNPFTGRFISAGFASTLEQALRTVFEDGAIVSQDVLSFGRVQESIVDDLAPEWEVIDTRWGQSWEGGDSFLAASQLAREGFPAGFSGYKVIYKVKDNPDYARGYASSEVLGPDQWPPRLDMVEGVDAEGIQRVIFRRA